MSWDQKCSPCLCLNQLQIAIFWKFIVNIWITGKHHINMQGGNHATYSGTEIKVGRVFMENIEIKEWYAHSCCLLLVRVIRKSSVLQEFRKYTIYLFWTHIPNEGGISERRNGGVTVSSYRQAVLHLEWNLNSCLKLWLQN